MLRRMGLLALVCGGWTNATPIFGPEVDLSQFRVTLFASQLTLPQGALRLSDGSILVQTSPDFTEGQLLRFVDTNGDGIADSPGQVLYSVVNGQGPITQLASAGSYFVQGTFGNTGIQVLQAGPAPGDALTLTGSFQFSYPGGWLHPTPGIAIRPSPGQPGFYDLIFNVGSQNNDSATPPNLVLVSGFGLNNFPLNGDSLYMVTLDLRDGFPVTASNPVQVATGIRNVFGLQFDSAGNLWFSDNAIDDDGDPDTFPPQADELNMIPAAALGNQVLNFGFPTCYPDYNTGAIGPVDNCVHPEVAFTPFNGMLSQGAAQITFGPPGFPTGYSDGIFISFSGVPGNTRNPVIYYDPSTGQYYHFILGGSTGNPLGLLAVGDSLFVTDWGRGEIWQITALAPEPASWGIGALGLAAIAWMRRRRRR